MELESEMRERHAASGADTWRGVRGGWMEEYAHSQVQSQTINQQKVVTSGGEGTSVVKEKGVGTPQQGKMFALGHQEMEEIPNIITSPAIRILYERNSSGRMYFMQFFCEGISDERPLREERYTVDNWAS
ncbi:hypothetical protein E6C27_scaffold25G00070 [Cucumis melo var. makuwa]|uniref:Uncharacterized protein n=1 Tax=Cucumis melo var. makuwa TaxID=1194695 RepID=A0A5A7VDP8_CUCMM|nr:hypothetical protein E6C27_scaffold25G00070 [Cucumis melo var. makuwa]